MNDFFKDLFYEIRFNEENKNIAKEMEEKLSIIMNKIDNETNSDHIFSDYKIYVQVINLLEEIDLLWNSIKNHSDNTLNIHRTLMTIEDLISLNEKYYEDSTK